MFFFARRKAIKLAKQVILEELSLGVPDKVSKKLNKYKYFGALTNLSMSSSICYFFRDERPFFIRVEYTKSKKLNFSINASELDLSYSQNGMKMIREQYPHYIFLFDKRFTSMYLRNLPADNMDTFVKSLRSEIRYWNNSGLYKLLLELYNVK